jgi:hypothetical protein
MQKLNGGFVYDVLPWMLEPLARLLPESLHVIPVSAGIAVPLIEMGIGLALVTNRFRTAEFVLRC